MDLHFCIASSKRDYGKQCRSRSDAGELGARPGPLPFTKKKKKKKKIIIIFIFIHPGAWQRTYSSPMNLVH